MFRTNNAAVSELLDQVKKIEPIIQGGVRESESERRLARSSVEALHQSGLYKLWCPQSLGGPDADLVDAIAVVEAIADIDTTAAWNLAVGTLHNGFAGAYLADHAIEAVFSGEDLVIAGQMAPIGKATPVDGGLRVTGSWTFCSGVHQANWLLGGALLQEDDKPPKPIVIMAPVEQVAIDGSSWEVAGLAGTGSCDCAMDDVFIPEGFWYGFPKAQRIRGGAVFDLSIPAQTMLLHAGIPLGAASRSLREITDLARTKVRAFSSNSVAHRATFQRELSEAYAKFSAVRLYVYDVAKRLQAAEEEGPALLEARAATRYVTDVALDIANWAYRSGGGSSLRLDNPLQHILRDLLAANQHIYVDETAYTIHGASMVGLDA
jgi:alkylation response protein AidB-like acyl-CoA dehydrogenase